MYCPRSHNILTRPPSPGMPRLRSNTQCHDFPASFSFSDMMVSSRIKIFLLSHLMKWIILKFKKQQGDNVRIWNPATDTFLLWDGQTGKSEIPSKRDKLFARFQEFFEKIGCKSRTT